MASREHSRRRTSLLEATPVSPKTVISPKAYNDGSWHQAIVTLSTNGMILYIDGQNAAADPATTTARNYQGYWKIGDDRINTEWRSAPANKFFNGSLRFAAVYNSALAPTQISNRYAAGLNN
ncbi:hypothetical protein IV498_18360 [Paenarthrobacter sp. Z7-10]|uniref:LamG-like jellyroll fold domain-containing protein n=1 Tax=Paenarthrobacter sp. Z7-10 TaxID=2787635 RepID=UPI0022A964DC|nr:LamG-like jellyroll fold domain-containing protein [Paenarthrobacter sp. Z7-10]MCZ2405063.1 hypothetical protein [Paenarthrobacter sp. Z7-10]